jgi:hypothetical protein
MGECCDTRCGLTTSSETESVSTLCADTPGPVASVQVHTMLEVQRNNYCDRRISHLMHAAHTCPMHATSSNAVERSLATLRTPVDILQSCAACNLVKQIPLLSPLTEAWLGLGASLRRNTPLNTDERIQYNVE